MRLLSALVVATTIANIAPSVAQAKGEGYSDRDWNVKFYSNCGFPIDSGKNKSLRKVKIQGDELILATLRPGDVGKCSTDAKPRNSADYWERAEIKQKIT